MGQLRLSFITIFFFLLTCRRLCFGADRIAQNETLSANQTLISSGNRFELGFFNPGNSSNYYLGIWYYQVSIRTVVWVANRESPVSDNSSVELRIEGGGRRLSLFNKTQIPFWSTDEDSESLTPTTTEAVLLDDGNFVLRKTEGEILWQSFEHPTNTFLPGAKLSRSKLTNKHTTVVPWKRNDDPAPGDFSLQLDPNGTDQFVILNSDSSLYWNSGIWNGRFFTSVPELRTNFSYNFFFIDNENETYFTYSLYNKSSIFHVSITEGGNIQLFSWIEATQRWFLAWSRPKLQCQVAQYCGAFGSCDDESNPTCHCIEGFVPKSSDEFSSNIFYSGCIRRSELRCGSSRNGMNNTDMFIRGYAVGNTVSGSPASRSAANVEECRSVCEDTCSCNAYAFEGGRCSVWNGEVYDMFRVGNGSSSSGVPIFVRVAAEVVSSGSKKSVLGAVLGSLAAAFVIGFVLLVALRWYRKRKLGKQVEENYNIANGDEDNNTKLTFFSIKNVLAATNNFSEANKLGEGGFGPVYKGVLVHDQEVAIKRLSKKSGQGLEEFMNELRLIAKLQHTYLVRLLGCCVEKEEKILIYEYLPNRSLDKFLFDSAAKTDLDWLTRIKIIEGIAQGLLYIHKYSRLKVIHRDLKASNVLLDAEMNPKISDFGMARIFGIDQAEANTVRIVGTYGYMSPEYAIYGKFSEKSDVFSYGVLLLEIVSGKRNTDFYDRETPFSLLCWAWELWKEGKPEELIDPSVKDANINAVQAVKFIHVGLLCVQQDPADRPTMSSVTQMLSSNYSQSFPLPGEPAFNIGRTAAAGSSDGVPADCSNNQMSVTMPAAGRRFELGFFKPGNSSNYYLGIWFYRVNVKKAVWVANRESPIFDLSSTVLRFSDGNLALFGESQILKWSTDSSSPCTEAVLQDDGNLVLRAADSSEIMWQSFDNPTDTLLPGAKLGHNKVTGKYITMVAWKSNDDPAPGEFSLQLDPNGTNQLVIIRNRSTLHWTSGLWNGRFFSSVPEMMWKNIYDFVYVDNEYEAYYAYSVLNKSLVFRKSVSIEGNFQVLIWNQNWNVIWTQPRSQCQVRHYCGAFGSCKDGAKPSCHCVEGFVPKSNDEYISNVFYSGCIRKSSIQCGESRNGTKKKTPADKFIPGYALTDNTSGSPAYRSLRNIQQCESTCLDSCSCNAYAYDNSTSACSIWSEEVYDIHSLADDSTGVPIFVRVAIGDVPPSSGTKRTVLGAVFGSIAAVVLISFLSFAASRWYRRHKLGNNVENSYFNAKGDQENNTKLTFFSIKNVLAATDNFSESNKLGEGGFGPVYKGILLPDHQEVAVKRLSKKSGQGLEEFMNELKLIAKLQHTYLVRLLGCCVEKDEKILIYEYLPNRSLDKFLFDSHAKADLDWLTRIKIIEGVAQGLLYIHKYSRLKVIHRDMKASNVLLDAEMNPKISDFGMARIFRIGQAEAKTKRIVGTYGYMSPEYVLYGKFSEKSDVFSYGVLLLEIVSGRKNTEFNQSQTPSFLLSWLWQEGKPEEIIDLAVKDTCSDAAEAVKFIHVGLLCVQDAPVKRPSMASVAQMLSSNDSQSFPLPEEPAFMARRAVIGTGNNCSNNQMSVTLSAGR
ncbi:G-type lectin S-receptor-like serine/threonine-protein kinase At1g11330 [Linum perenne]